MSKFLLLLFMLASANTFAAISKWVDAQGQVHYSDQPPPPMAEVKTFHSVSEVEATAGASGVAAASAPEAQKSIAEQLADLKKAEMAKQAAADKAAKEQAAAAARKTSCANAQENLRTLQSGERMVQINANGERSYLDDAQRQQRIDKVQQDIGRLCD